MSAAGISPELLGQLNTELIDRELARRAARRHVLDPTAWSVLERTVIANPYIPHVPTPPQARFLALPQEEGFYGGAAGGGKSDAILMGGLQYVQVPGYASVLFRRTYQDLAKPGALMDRAAQWLTGSGARWDGEKHQWRFRRPDGPDAVLSFSYMETEADKYKHQSAEYDFIGWDELVQFAKTMYSYMFSRLRRRAGSQIPPRVRSGSNPPDKWQRAEGAWVGEHFGVETGGVPGRPFIPARLDDNPHVDREQYRISLAHLDPTTRRQLEDGDWSAKEPGEFFKAEWFDVVDAAPAGLMELRRWDLAGTEAKLVLGRGSKDPDWTAGARVGKTAQGVYYVLDVRRKRASPGDIEHFVRQTAMLDGVDIPVWISQDPGQAGKAQVEHYVMRVLPGWPVWSEPETGDKQLRARPASAQAQVRNVKLVRGPWNRAFLDELEGFPGADYDDQVDAFSGAMAVLMRQGYVAPTVENLPTTVQEIHSQRWREHLAKVRGGNGSPAHDDGGVYYPGM